ncbi:PREDICTED: discoidin, CUB and LCCL domain-containing protein 2-like isoform X7 [Acropora digitifera]|uniref:discoidin, CUB and LCCL domain-containing protein 2-like isoform X7 n=1 Tax=Acropora digitifera TaxID=70779 RepID=UPI00077B091B|nr:PREDICTED: discoidin, CUB and LCCL domain-containing protein 2-like isoform X7 [Acropora digitifera]
MQRNAECDAALGFENLEVWDSQLTAQSIPIHIRLEAGREMDTHARCGRLNMHYCAFCGSSENGQYLQVDLRQDYKITAVATQGFEALDNNYFVESYNLSQSRDGQNWSIFPEVMKGNNDGRSVVKHTFSSPMYARYVRLYPTAYSHGGFCLRMELYGCSNSFSALTPTPSPSTQRGANNTTPENVSPTSTTTSESSTEKSMITDSATGQPAVRRSKVLITTRWEQETTPMKWIIFFPLIIIICLLGWFIGSIKNTFLPLFQSQSGSMVV